MPTELQKCMVVMEIKSLLHKSLQREKKHNLIKGLNTVVVLICVLHNTCTFLHEKSFEIEIAHFITTQEAMSTVYACIGNTATSMNNVKNKQLFLNYGGIN